MGGRTAPVKAVKALTAEDAKEDQFWAIFLSSEI